MVIYIHCSTITCVYIFNLSDDHMVFFFAYDIFLFFCLAFVYFSFIRTRVYTRMHLHTDIHTYTNIHYRSLSLFSHISIISYSLHRNSLSPPTFFSRIINFFSISFLLVYSLPPFSIICSLCDSLYTGE